MKPWIDGVAIDKEIAEAYPCDECGGKMTYRAEYEADESGERKAVYRAFAVCTNPECKSEIEF